MHKLLTTLKDVTATVRAIFPARSQWRVPPLLLLLLTAVLWPVDPAWAQALTPIVTVANNIATVLTGPFGVSVATIGLVACGFLAMAGRMPWSAAIAVIAGIILVFGAATIVTEIRGVAN